MEGCLEPGEERESKAARGRRSNLLPLVPVQAKVQLVRRTEKAPLEVTVGANHAAAAAAGEAVRRARVCARQILSLLNRGRGAAPP